MPSFVIFNSRRLDEIAENLAIIKSQLASVLFNQQKEKTTMSALTDAVASLTAAEKANHEELVLVLEAVKAFPAKLQTAIDEALAKGVSPEDLAAIQAVKDQQAADTQAMADALASPPPVVP